VNEILSEEAVRAALRLPMLIDALADSFQGDDLETSARVASRFRNDLWAGVSTAVSRSRGIVSMKVATERMSGSHAIGDSLLTLTDLDTGELFAAMQAETLTQFRTAATTIAIARHLGRDVPSRIALLGSGRIAETHVVALCETVPFHTLIVGARNVVAARAMLERSGVAHDARITIETEVRRAVAGAQLVITATSAREPLLRGEWLADDAHVAAIGSYDETTSELHADVFARASTVLVEDPHEAALAGDVAAALTSGAIAMHDLRTPDQCPRTAAGGITLWKSVGSAGHDLVTAWHVWRNSQLPRERSDARIAHFRS